jgi:hypothetical protein
MATKRSSSGSAKTARTTAKTAGKPVQEGASRSRKVAVQPTAEDLDLRDRLKSQPRRPAGPPLVGDVQTRAALEALRNEVLPAPTDPSGKGR